MATSKNFIVKNGLEVGGQEVIDSSGVVTSAALGGQTLGTTDSPTFAGLTVTTVDLNGGTIDGTVIGGATPAAGSFTTITGSDDLNIDSGTLFVDASANAVGIGTTSPQLGASWNKVLHIHSAGGLGAHIRFTDTTSGATNTDGMFIGQYGVDSYVINRESGNMVFWTDATERMRIDSSGTLLVGRTTASTVNAGGRISADGFAGFTRDGDTVLLANRLTSDGEIVRIQKDGSTVGSINTEGGDVAIGNADAGLQFVDGAERVRPFNISTNAATDALLDLGESGKRFKDLYLSGGVYLGGTGAANQLDDYEEGTWTPTTNGDATGVFSGAAGAYTKIGNIVHVRAVVTVSTNFTDTEIGGLPFTVGSGGASFGSAYGWNGSVIAGALTGVVCTAVQGFTYIDLLNDGNTSSGHIPSTTGGTYRLSVTYQVA